MIVERIGPLDYTADVQRFRVTTHLRDLLFDPEENLPAITSAPTLDSSPVSIPLGEITIKLDGDGLGNLRQAIDRALSPMHNFRCDSGLDSLRVNFGVSGDTGRLNNLLPGYNKLRWHIDR